MGRAQASKWVDLPLVHSTPISDMTKRRMQSVSRVLNVPSVHRGTQILVMAGVADLLVGMKRFISEPVGAVTREKHPMAEVGTSSPKRPGQDFLGVYLWSTSQIKFVQLTPIGCVERSSPGDTYPIRIFCPLPSLPTHSASAFLPSGCLTEIPWGMRSSIPQ